MNVKDDQGRINRMMKLRNPWGYNEWKGKGHEADHAFWARVPHDQKVHFETSA